MKFHHLKTNNHSPKNKVISRLRNFKQKVLHFNDLTTLLRFTVNYADYCTPRKNPLSAQQMSRFSSQILLPSAKVDDHWKLDKTNEAVYAYLKFRKKNKKLSISAAANTKFEKIESQYRFEL